MGEPFCGIQAGGLTEGSRWLSASDTTGKHSYLQGPDPGRGRSPILLHTACCGCDPSGVGGTLPLVPVVSLALNHRQMAAIPPGSATTIAAKCWSERFISFAQGSALTSRQVRRSEPAPHCWESGNPCQAAVPCQNGHAFAFTMARGSATHVSPIRVHQRFPPVPPSSVRPSLPLLFPWAAILSSSSR